MARRSSSNAAAGEGQLDSDQERARRTKNVRTGLILATIALAFFIGFVIRRFYQ